ncbi:MAG: ribonuclease D, partial [Phycisphaerales bacterium]|nr:ribonuclease D [Phycisphaerales bacterium]
MDNAPPSSIPDHPLIPGGPPAMVTDQAGLTALCATLRDAGRFAYDTEFIGELSYYPKLCLIQVATETDVTLIDPFGELELTEFWELLADPDVEKILHAGQQDLEPVVRLLDREPANIFDTQIYAGFASLAYPTSLLKMVGELVNVSLGKALTFTHWDARPLSAVHQRYAADDVRYLHAIRAAILERLDHDVHSIWAREECEALCAKEQYIFDPSVRWQRVRGGRNLKPRQIAILKELVAVRDVAAREHDVPPRTMIRDEVLLALARHPVKSIEELGQVRGLPRPVEHAYGAAIVKAIETARALPSAALTSPAPVDESTLEKRQIDSLWSVVTAFCHGKSIDPALVGTRHD